MSRNPNVEIDPEIDIYHRLPVGHKPFREVNHPERPRYLVDLIWLPELMLVALLILILGCRGQATWHHWVCGGVAR
jgi:hypothetical protein